MAEIPSYSLFEAEREGHAAFVSATGDGTTTHLRVTVRNNRDYPIQVRIEPGTAFTPRNHSFQDMAVIRSTVLNLEPLETRVVWLNTACLQPERNPPYENSAAAYLRQQNFMPNAIEDILDKSGNRMQIHVEDLYRIGRAMGYNDRVLGEMRTNLETMARGAHATMQMGYRLQPLPEERANWVRCISQAIEEIDTQISRISALSSESSESLTRTYDPKDLIKLLCQMGIPPQQFLTDQALINFDSALTHNVFEDSGYSFKPGEALLLTEHDIYNDPEGRLPRRLQSLVAQFAIWAATDDYDLEQCRGRFSRNRLKKPLLAAGVRSVLNRAVEAAPTYHIPSRSLKSKLPLFAGSRPRRFVARIMHRL
ncbi:MAG: hypothetical protein JW963_04910 [Anaerolineales bacterium]|nr:hypothetical protein [Anaerolineales bacterium]